MNQDTKPTLPDRALVNGRYSGVTPPEGTAAPAVDRTLRKNAHQANYASDAQAIAKVLVRHYGDEADAVLKLAIERLGDARRGKR